MVLAASSAAAEVFDFTISAPSVPETITGQFTVTPGAGGVDTVTAVTGTLDISGETSPISGIISSYSPGPTPDNKLYTLSPGTGFLDASGIGFSTGNSGPLNDFDFVLYFGGSSGDQLSGTSNLVGGTTIVGATLSIDAVPEPAAWALMLAGFAGLGATLRSRRSRLASPATAPLS